MAREVLHGNGAARLPGAEILLDLGHGQKISDHLIKMPDNTFVRWFPVPGRMPSAAFPSSERGLLRLAKGASVHHSALTRESQGKIHVNPYRSFVADMPYNKNHSAIITTTKCISGHKLGERHTEAAPVVTGLARYLSWHSRTRQSDILRDIFYPWQYIAHWGQVTLADIDPVLLHESSYDSIKELLLSWEAS